MADGYDGGMEQNPYESPREQPSEMLVRKRAPDFWSYWVVDSIKLVGAGLAVIVAVLMSLAIIAIVADSFELPRSIR